MKENDPLGQAISVADELTKRGIKGALNRRAAAAIDRLLGTAVDFLHTESGRADGGAGDAVITAALAEHAAKAMEPREREILQPVLATHYRDILVRHGNRRAVVAYAVEELRRTARALDSLRGGNERVGDDWLNFFADYAEKAASEMLREAFGRILSGEILKPRTFSLPTLRIVSELDAGSAGIFQKLAARAFSMDATVGTPSALLKPEGLKGQLLHQLLKLEALGLVQEVGGDFAISASNAAPGAQIWVRFGRLLLRGEIKSKVFFSLPLLKLTDAGAELCSIIPMDPQGGAREVGSLMARRGLEATIHVITSTANGDVRYRTKGETVRA